jgi:hypothetical protein
MSCGHMRRTEATHASTGTPTGTETDGSLIALLRRQIKHSAHNPYHSHCLPLASDSITSSTVISPRFSTSFTPNSSFPSLRFLSYLSTRDVSSTISLFVVLNKVVIKAKLEGRLFYCLTAHSVHNALSCPALCPFHHDFSLPYAWYIVHLL